MLETEKTNQVDGVDSPHTNEDVLNGLLQLNPLLEYEKSSRNVMPPNLNNIKREELGVEYIKADYFDDSAKDLYPNQMKQMKFFSQTKTELCYVKTNRNKNVVKYARKAKRKMVVKVPEYTFIQDGFILQVTFSDLGFRCGYISYTKNCKYTKGFKESIFEKYARVIGGVTYNDGKVFGLDTMSFGTDLETLKQYDIDNKLLILMANIKSNRPVITKDEILVVLRLTKKHMIKFSKSLNKRRKRKGKL